MAGNYVLQEEFFQTWTLDLYNPEDGTLGLSQLETYHAKKEAIMQELGVRNEKDIWPALCNPEFSIPMFDIISWFNRQYIEIKKEAANIPPIQHTVFNPMTREYETINFRYYKQIDEDTYTVYFIEDPINISNFYYRVLSICDGNGRRNSSQASCYAELTTRINRSASYSEIIDIDESILRQILSLSKKYQNYLEAYSFFTNNPYFRLELEWPLCQKGGLHSSIIGKNPFNSLNKFVFAVGPMTNERFFSDIYKLGTPVLGFPEHFHTDNVYGKETALEIDTHVFAKTLRLPTKRLPFKID